LIVPDVTRDEAAIVKAAIGRLDEAAQLKVKAGIVTAAAAVRAVGGDGAKAWPLRCPLLGDDHRCRIYDHRPSSCRAWASLDAKACADALNTKTDVLTPAPLQSVLARASLSLLRGVFNLALPKPLPLALEAFARKGGA
jgi:hypothetical protein